jgi:Carbohydrate family 9 binding domain-like
MPRSATAALAAVILSILAAGPARSADSDVPLAKGVRGLVTRVSGGVVVDGKLTEWTTAYCTPVHYGHAMLAERAAQFFYQWDDDALYIGLRCLDTKRANPGEKGAVYNGDAVEFYLDTRSGESLRSKDWTEGAVHLFYSPFLKDVLAPRWVMRQGIATSATNLEGVEVAATVQEWGYECEFKVPWANFPKFKAKLGATLAIDAELCSGDGGARTDRTFAYGSPLSVQQPASLGLVELVKAFDPDYFAAAGPASFPMTVETPWNQAKRAECRAVIAIPPAFADIVGPVDVRLHDADGKVIATLPARVESFGPEGKHFARAVATWSIDDHAPNTYFATAKISARTGRPIVTVTPRMVQEANMTGR